VFLLPHRRQPLLLPRLLRPLPRSARNSATCARDSHTGSCERGNRSWSILVATRRLRCMETVLPPAPCSVPRTFGEQLRLGRALCCCVYPVRLILVQAYFVTQACSFFELFPS
jgi:hypothetical protein